MKFKAILPYFLLGSLVSTPKMAGEFRPVDNINKVQTQYSVKSSIPTKQERIEQRSKELCDTYIDLVLQGQNNIKHSKLSHRNAVLQEFPGAVVRWYCIYGQYTQLNRAVREMGDTLTFIPFGCRHSCPGFRTEMKQKYSGKKYAGALHNGKMFKSDTEYNRALNAYLKQHRVTDETADSVRQKITDKFAQNNFSVEALHPGTILIIQKSATPSNTHAVMYVGRGRVEDGKFIEDSDGKFICAGYNNESLGDVFTLYNTNRIFATDIYAIANVKYAEELEKIQNMKNEDLFRFVYDVPTDMYAIVPKRSYLQEMAMEKYFNRENYTPQYPVVPTNVAGFNLSPTKLFMKTYGGNGR